MDRRVPPAVAGRVREPAGLRTELQKTRSASGARHNPFASTPAARQTCRRAALATGAAIVPERPAETVSYAAAAAGRLHAAARAARDRAGARLHGWLRGLSRLTAAVLRLHRPLGLAVGVGAAVGLGCYLAGPTVAAAVSGVAGFAASLAASALRAVQGTLARAAAPHP